MKLPGRLVAGSASLMLVAGAMTLVAPRALAWTDIDIVAIVVQPVTTQVNTAMTPGARRASSTSTRVMRAWATGLRRNEAWTMPFRWRSST